MKIRQLSYVQTIALGFLTVIAAGTILLMLPVSSQSGGTTGFANPVFLTAIFNTPFLFILHVFLLNYFHYSLKIL